MLSFCSLFALILIQTIINFQQQQTQNHHPTKGQPKKTVCCLFVTMSHSNKIGNCFQEAKSLLHRMVNKVNHKKQKKCPKGCKYTKKWDQRGKSFNTIMLTTNGMTEAIN